MLSWLHIAEEVAVEAKRQNYKCVGILGTRFLMEGSVYPSKFSNLSIEYRIPAIEDRQHINEIIFDQLVCGRFSSEARTYFKFFQIYQRMSSLDLIFC